MTKLLKKAKVEYLLGKSNVSYICPLGKKDSEKFIYMGKTPIRNITNIDRIYKASGRCSRLDVTVNSAINIAENFSCNEGMDKVIQFNYSHNDIEGLYENETGFMIDIEQICLEDLKTIVSVCKKLQKL